MYLRRLVTLVVIFACVAIVWPGHAQPQRIAVLEFAGDGSVEESLLGLLADRVRNAALRRLDTREWEVMTRENMLVLLEANTEDLAACLGECEVETGQLIGAHMVVSGSVVRAGSRIWITLRSFDTDTGRLIASEENAASDIDGLIDAVPELCARLFAGRAAGADDEFASIANPAQEQERVQVVQIEEVQPPWTAQEVPEPTASGDDVLGQYGYSMVRIEAGEYMMGTAAGIDLNPKPRHMVVISQAFAMGATEVPQDLYEAVVGSNPSANPGPRLPVETVSWNNAVMFCNELSELEGLSPAYEITPSWIRWDREATGYRLPTEAEWEYAARAGTSTPYYWGSSASKTVVSRHAWYGYNAPSTQEVGVKEPNAWGLHDMIGNVSEWVLDALGQYSPGRQVDPTGPEIGLQAGRMSRIFRGGDWNDDVDQLRCYERSHLKQTHTLPGQVGFRIVKPLR